MHFVFLEEQSARWTAHCLPLGKVELLGRQSASAQKFTNKKYSSIIMRPFGEMKHVVSLSSSLLAPKTGPTETYHSAFQSTGLGRRQLWYIGRMQVFKLASGHSQLTKAEFIF